MAGVHVAWQGLIGSQTAPKLKTSTFFWFSYKMSKSRKFSSEAFLACLKNSIFEKRVISPSPQTKKLFFFARVASTLLSLSQNKYNANQYEM
jgi:hypothetical protein